MPKMKALARLFGVSRHFPTSRCFSTSQTVKQGLLKRLKDGGSVVVAEGYLWELERRGFLQFGNFLPEVVLEKPEAVEMLHEEFALAGSDVIEAFTVSVPAVITLAAHFPDRTTDEVPIPEACKRLEDQGAAVVGLNCSRGPDIMMPLIREVKNACKGPIAALPVPYRTTGKQKTFFSVKDPKSGKLVYPDNLDCVRCSRTDIRLFAEDAKEAGIQYIGLCCGNSASLTREVAEVYGKNPPASKYSTSTEQSFIFGDSAQDYGEEMRKLAKFMKGE
ncbi:S-methylmethionine--homocysteine S-methyltransferase BHMT2-like [Mercenaria mercenaria]|uniref:S-methylmethionine--homocysteine S-methyltransferase BHMT2-like n=1 Tax=Mercenaria mercenaria TaxID=6596 RepID=UPI00234F734E|nr:S-methylmethionine--homocysteine S-methyltransferase BHMT2-like [Mercenaria mercenaria]